MACERQQLEDARKLLDQSPKKAVKILQRLAESGNFGAVTLLGYASENGLGVSKNLNVAYERYRLAANEGNLDATMQLAVWGRDGRAGFEKNESEMLKYLAFGTSRNDSRAWFELGCYFHRLDPGTDEHRSEAFRCFMKAAQLGHLEAQVWAGEALLFGFGCRKNEQKGIELLEQAIQGGSLRSKYLMADFLVRDDASRDFKSAYLLACDAAKGGDSDAEFLLGWMLLRGVGVKPDIGKAKKLLSSAALKGNRSAKRLLEENEEANDGGLPPN